MAQCPHGFAPDDCLICATLRSSPAQGAGNGPALAVADRDRGEGGRRRPWANHDPDRGADTVTVVEPGRAPRRPAGRPLTMALLVIVALIAVVAGFWLVAGVVFALLRIIEVVAVAVAAGWIGYRVGHWRGRHDH
ncbi:MAG: hypothetical protein M3Y36_01880 [Actinomycetota bacterium]|nr:hypothetical protein [Actinomycetota bacterium]